MLDAVREVCGSESEFSQKLVTLAVGTGNPVLLGQVFDRIQPKDRATYPDTKFTYDKTAPLTDQVTQIIEEVSKGKLAPDVGKMMVDAISTAMKIEEFTVIKEDFYKFIASKNVGTDEKDS